MNIIITGGSKGIGKALAEKFALAGNTLFICSRNAKELYDTVAFLQDNYPDTLVKAMPVDMRVKEDVMKFAKWCLEAGTPDILINNAGQFVQGGVIDEEEGALEQMIEVNLYSAYHFTRALVPSLLKAGKGHIFNICSIASLHAYANGGSYGISKYAMLGFTRNLREELKPHGVKVTAVFPGATMSSSWEGADIPKNRIMEVEDIATMIFAASQLSPMAVVEDIVLRPQLGDL